uniref:Uncharacterized protein n=1 Tax=Arundo donax TaxID=35708 RepID=A0A0A9EUI4_ARUDO
MSCAACAAPEWDQKMRRLRCGMAAWRLSSPFARRHGLSRRCCLRRF